MHYSLTTQHIQLSAADTQQIELKLTRLTKFITPPFHIDIVVSHDTHHQQGAVIAGRINLTQGGRIFHVERSASSALTAIDECVEALQQELKKAKDKQRRASRGWRSLFGWRKT